MNMIQPMSRWGAFFCAALLFTSCEKDDVCGGLNAKTPLVNIEFYQQDNINQLRAPQELQCYAVGHKTKIVFRQQSKISLPLEINASATDWVLEYRTLVNNDTVKKVDTLKFAYNTESYYISKACGYRSVFKNVSTTINSNTGNQAGYWMVSQESMNEISNENDIHVKVLF